MKYKIEELKEGKKEIVLKMMFPNKFNEGKEVWSITSLANLLNLTKPTINYHINQLNNLGIVKFRLTKGEPQIVEKRAKKGSIKDIELIKKRIIVKNKYNVKDDVFINLFPIIPSFIVIFFLPLIINTLLFTSLFLSGTVFSLMFFLFTLYKVLTSKKSVHVYSKIPIRTSN